MDEWKELTKLMGGSKGFSLVYTSENLSLAALELFVHVPPGMIPDDLVSIRGTLPDNVSTETVEESKLPEYWRKYPAPVELQEIGTHWLQQGTSCVLVVPSAINPLENSLLLNPAHPDSRLLEVEQGQPFHFDPRRFGK